IGGGEQPPAPEIVNRVGRLFDEVHSRLQEKNDSFVTKTSNRTDFQNQLAALNEVDAEGIVRFGDSTFGISDALYRHLSAQGFESGEISSVVRNMVMGHGERNAYEIGSKDGRQLIYPVDSTGRIMYDQISNDITGQITVALKHNLNPLESVRV